MADWQMPDPRQWYIDMDSLGVQTASEHLRVVGIASMQVPWPGHLHMSAGSPYFSRKFDQQHAAAKKQYTAMESLRVQSCWHYPVVCLVQTQILLSAHHVYDVWSGGD